jgi:putative transposase
MRKSRFSEEQIAYALRQVESGTPGEIFYRWKRKYAGMGVAELRRVKQLEEENGRVKRLGRRPDPRQGDAAGRAHKKLLGPRASASASNYLEEHHRVSERRACKVVPLARSTVAKAARIRARRMEARAVESAQAAERPISIRAVRGSTSL